jgi:hypothetical protein
MRYSKGVMWLDDCRIPFVDDDIPSGGYGKATIGYGNEYEYKGGAGKTEQQGRFTPNLLVCDDMLNDGIEHKSGKVKPHHKRNKTMGEYQGNAYGKFNNVSPDLNYDAYYADKGSNSRYYDLDLWFDKILERL